MTHGAGRGCHDGALNNAFDRTAGAHALAAAAQLGAHATGAP
jgi:hypothetical protein